MLDTPNPGKGLRPLHSCTALLGGGRYRRSLLYYVAGESYRKVQ